jgi:cellulose synthase/poly-beta-1,6-N-acetylglucosamine synthase-like glycosyltransferase
MFSFATATLVLLSIIVLIPVMTFSLQCFLSFLPGRKSSIERDKLPRLAVLIPAHNEEAIVSGILKDVKSQTQENDRVIVIADNCEDGTAAVAKQHGAEAFERTDLSNRGKAYALRFALEKLEADPPEVVIVVDADCRISPDALAHLSYKAATQDRPIQGSYIFGEHHDGVASNNASSFTLWFKNHIRPLGSLRAGMPCQLTGSGMAFPWHVIRQVNVANESLAEDTTLGLELAYAGHPPSFCPEARIDGHVPKEWGTLVQQRRRWEQGYLESILSNAPKMTLRAITSFRPSLLWAALDLCIPPLALLGIAWGMMALLAFVFVLLGGSWLPAILLGIGAVCMGCSLIFGWLIHCRDKVPAKAILAMPWFLIRKVGIYASLLLKREKVWLRTERD